MRGLQRREAARILAAGLAFARNIRQGHCGLATDALARHRHRLRAAFGQLALTV